MKAYADGSRLPSNNRLGYAAAVFEEDGQWTVLCGNTHRGPNVLPAEVLAMDLALRNGATEIFSDSQAAVLLAQECRTWKKLMRSLNRDCPAAVQAAQRLRWAVAVGDLVVEWRPRCSTVGLVLADAAAGAAANHLQ